MRRPQLIREVTDSPAAPFADMPQAGTADVCSKSDRTTDYRRELTHDWLDPVTYGPKTTPDRRFKTIDGCLVRHGS